MIATTVAVYVKPEYVEEFIEATLLNHQGSVLENGNLRFYVLQSTEDPTRFTLYETFESEDAVKAHKQQTGHYLKWRKTVENWMAKPRVGVPHRVVRPLEKNAWYSKTFRFPGFPTFILELANLIN